MIKLYEDKEGLDIYIDKDQELIIDYADTSIHGQVFYAVLSIEETKELYLALKKYYIEKDLGLLDE